MSRVVNMYVYTKFSRAIKFMDFAVSMLSAKLQSSKKNSGIYIQLQKINCENLAFHEI